MAGNSRQPGGAAKRKGPSVGTGGHGRKALEGRGPTPKAEDRTYHAAHKRKQAVERLEAKREQTGRGETQRPTNSNGLRSSGQRTSNGAKGAPKRRASGDELVTGRNAVLEALRAKIPATTLYIAARVEFDDRVREILSIANNRGIPVLEVMRPELDRMSGGDLLHQGVVLTVREYEYAHALDLLDAAKKRGTTPLIVALDGVTDPRNLGAIIRSVAAFGGDGVLLPQRRSAGVTAAAWRTSAGAVSRVPVAMVPNLAQAIVTFKERGVFVAGLDGGGDVAMPALGLADRPLLIVVGSEGAGLSRIIRERCDVIVSIPIAADTESLNAGIATAIALYQVATLRSAAE